MRTRLLAIFVATSLATAACARHSPKAVEWRGRTFQEVGSLSDLPAGIRSGLGASRPGVDGVAERNHPFNLTDVVNTSLPMRRFLAAGTSEDAWLVAVERGGRGYAVEVFFFSEPDTPPEQKWVLLERPTTLREIIQRVSQLER